MENPSNFDLGDYFAVSYAGDVCFPICRFTRQILHLTIQPPADATRHPPNSTPRHGSRCVLNTFFSYCLTASKGVGRTFES
jgi:hypothetical protein